MAISHAKEKLEGLVADFEPETMRHYEGPNWHLKRFFIRSESEYESMHPPSGISHPTFKKALQQLELKVPFSSHWPPHGIIAEQRSSEKHSELPSSGVQFWSNGKVYPSISDLMKDVAKGDESGRCG